MGRYRVALEKAGDLRAAVEVMHRDETVRDQLASSEREKALVDLTAKFDNERRARQIELLERDNAIKSRDLRAQRLRQQMIVMSAALVVLACAALFWGIARIRKINASLLHNIQHDSLTGLLNRRYFNEHILAGQADRPYVGCLLMAALDNTEHINDTWGYAASDAVLRAVSQRLSSALPDSDAWVHWAGEVFLVKTGPMSEAQLNLAARRLLSEIHREPVAWDGRDIGCTVSVGYASFPIKGAAADISLERAITLVDQALRQARLQGGDRACLITLVRAANEQESSFSDAQFDGTTSDRRVQLVETVSMTA
jgi:diguanylate cyclase (GGDEF)-like protein